MDLAVGIDVGGTKIASALVGPQGLLGPMSTEPTDVSGQAALLQQIGRVARERLETTGRPGTAKAVGLATAGLIQQPGGVVRLAPNLPLKDVALAEALWGSLGLPVIAENDVNAIVVAECRLGAAKGLSEVVCLAIGTGIGGGIMTDGRVYRGATGMAGEIGHMVVEPDGPVCSCGGRGHLEALSSGRALEREGRAKVLEGSKSLITELAGGDPDKITGEHVTQAAGQGDAVALEIVRRAGRYLGMALAGVAAVLEPEAIVLGGGVMDAGELILEPAREALGRDVVGGKERQVKLIRAALGAQAGVVGAGLIALESV